MKKYILILLLFLSCLTFAFEKNVTAKTNTITFSNKQVMKTWFYPYRDPAGRLRQMRFVVYKVLQSMRKRIFM